MILAGPITFVEEYWAALIAIFVAFVAFVFVVVWFGVQQLRPKATRGFEVKPTAGQSPATFEKERANDHG
jgi:hypothetical protein